MVIWWMGKVPGGLALWREDEADALGGDEKADGDTGFAQETLEAGLRRGVPTVSVLFRRGRGCAGFVEIGTRGKLFHQDQRLGLGVASLFGASRHHLGGAERFTVLGQAGEQVVGGSGQVGLAPIPEFASEGREVLQAQVAVEVGDTVAAQDFLLEADVVAEDRLSVLQSRGGRRRDLPAGRTRSRVGGP